MRKSVFIFGGGASITFLVSLALMLSMANVCFADTQPPAPMPTLAPDIKLDLKPAPGVAKPAVKPAATVHYIDVEPMAVVQNPQKYMDKNIKMKGTFDKFSVVGLDYKPAFRASEDYILFLIRKSTVKDHVIPLAEMKLFMTRKEAEKYIDLESGDEIQFSGKLFSAALGDPWIDVDSITILKKNKKAEDKNKEVKQPDEE